MAQPNRSGSSYPAPNSIGSQPMNHTYKYPTTTNPFVSLLPSQEHEESRQLGEYEALFPTIPGTKTKYLKNVLDINPRIQPATQPVVDIKKIEDEIRFAILCIYYQGKN